MSKFNEKKMEQLVRVARDLIKTGKSYDRTIMAMLEPALTPSKKNALRNKMETAAEYIEDQLHELHCVCVELELADPQQWRYGEKKITSANGWAQLLKVRRHPQV